MSGDIEMMGQQAGNQDRLFYRFHLDDHVPTDHLLRGIDRFLDLSDLRRHLALLAYQMLPYVLLTGRATTSATHTNYRGRSPCVCCRGGHERLLTPSPDPYFCDRTHCTSSFASASETAGRAPAGGIAAGPQ